MMYGGDKRSTKPSTDRQERKMQRRSPIRRFAAGALLVLAATAAHAEYPEKPITFVVPFAAGIQPE